jgi:prevent-host-death family protein
MTKPEVVTVHQAKTHLSKLLVRAEAGEEIVIARGKKPIARLVPNQPEAPLPLRQPGRWKGLVHADADAFAPMTDEELREWGLL